MEIDYYASDRTNVSLETLAHVIIAERTRGGIERREKFAVLAADNEHQLLATVER
jgi:hypothetical protein